MFQGVTFTLLGYHLSGNVAVTPPSDQLQMIHEENSHPHAEGFCGVVPLSAVGVGVDAEGTLAELVEGDVGGDAGVGGEVAGGDGVVSVGGVEAGGFVGAGAGSGAGQVLGIIANGINQVADNITPWPVTKEAVRSGITS